MSRVLNLLLTHQAAPAIARMLAWWRSCCSPDDALVAFNGSEAAFDAITHPQKVRVTDPRLSTRSHQRERQSYTGVWAAASRWMEGRDYTHVHFAEYDQVPLVPDLNARQIARLESEGADVLGFHLTRVDRTNQPHFLYHAAMPGFSAHWRALSVREDKGTALSMLGTGSFWTRAAFDAVAQAPEPVPVYLELYLSTTAHHLGYRLRDWGDQGRYIHSAGEFSAGIEQARRDGAWTLHPVKTLWNAPAP